MRLVRAWFPYFFLLYWLIVFFPQWYALSYTKVWELKRLVLRNRDQQLRVLHSGQMGGLLALRDRLGDLPVDSTFVLLGSSSAQLPLAGNPAMARAVLFPYAVGAAGALPEEAANIIILEAGSADQPCQKTELPYGAAQECWRIQP